VVLSNISEEHAASIFTHTLKKEAVDSSEALLNTSNTSRRINPEHHHLKLNRQENLKSCMHICVMYLCKNQILWRDDCKYMHLIESSVSQEEAV